MVNRSEILRSAWADYRRDRKLGLIAGGRECAFNREHFAYCLRMAWAVAKDRAAQAAATAHGPIATIMGAVRLLDAVTAARIVQIRDELLWQELGERIDWPVYGALKAELATLTT